MNSFLQQNGMNLLSGGMGMASGMIQDSRFKDRYNFGASDSYNDIANLRTENQNVKKDAFSGMAKHTAQGAMMGSQFGLIGAGIGAGVGLLGSAGVGISNMIKGNKAMDKAIDDTRENAYDLSVSNANNQIGYNPTTQYFKNGGMLKYNEGGDLRSAWRRYKTNSGRVMEGSIDDLLKNMYSKDNFGMEEEAYYAYVDKLSKETGITDPAKLHQMMLAQNKQFTNDRVMDTVNRDNFATGLMGQVNKAVKSSGMLPNEFSHKTNPLHIVDDNGNKVAEATGGELILNPEQKDRALQGDMSAVKEAYSNGNTDEMNVGGLVPIKGNTFDYGWNPNNQDFSAQRPKTIHDVVGESTLQQSKTKNSAPTVFDEKEMYDPYADLSERSRNQALLEQGLNAGSMLNNLFQRKPTNLTPREVRLNRVSNDIGANVQAQKDAQNRALAGARYRARGGNPYQTNLLLQSMKNKGDIAIAKGKEDAINKQRMMNTEIANKELLMNNQAKSRADLQNRQMQDRFQANKSAMLTQGLSNIGSIQRNMVQNQQNIDIAKYENDMMKLESDIYSDPDAIAFLKKRADEVGYAQAEKELRAKYMKEKGYTR